MLKGIGVLAGVRTPALDRVIRWAQGYLGKRYVTEEGDLGPHFGETSAPQTFGIAAVGQLLP